MEMAWRLGAIAAIAALVATIGATRLVLVWLHHKQILDLPNERSSHSLPTPRGGGLGVTPVVTSGLILAAFFAATPGSALLAAGALILMAVSWLDDRRGLPPLPRFLLQALVIAAWLLGLPGGSLVLGGVLPAWADHVLAGLGWLWFVNLYNFMDGIDGITGVETAAIGLGIALVATLAGETALVAPSLIVAAAGAGFLVWNWHPARIFLGDSGSIPLGFILGGLLILLATRGQLAAALILPAYYLADATITLGWRLKDGEKVWQAHRRHFYQRALRGGKSHAQVARAIAFANAALVALAVLAASGWPLPASAGAAVVVVALLRLFSRWASAAGGAA